MLLHIYLYLSFQLITKLIILILLKFSTFQVEQFFVNTIHLIQKSLANPFHQLLYLHQIYLCKLCKLFYLKQQRIARSDKLCWLERDEENDDNLSLQQQLTAHKSLSRLFAFLNIKLNLLYSRLTFSFHSVYLQLFVSRLSVIFTQFMKCV